MSCADADHNGGDGGSGGAGGGAGGGGISWSGKPKTMVQLAGESLIANIVAQVGA